MSASVKWHGLSELQAALRQLPGELRDDAMVLVIEAGDQAKNEIQASYEASKVSGNLARGVTAKPEPTGSFGAKVVVKSSAKHAFIFENGTQTRKNSFGANRGAMPPGNVFVPIMQRVRRSLNSLLVDLVRRAGFEIRGAL